jgi:hypothetical protein
LLVYGAGIAASVKLGAWFPRAPAKSGAA